MLRAGLIGFPSSGKTALFQLLTSAREAPRAGGKADANVGVSRVPDARLDRLTAMFNPRKRVPATVEFADIAGAGGARTGAQALLDVAPFRNADALLHVVRMFRDPSVPHPAGIARSRARRPADGGRSHPRGSRGRRTAPRTARARPEEGRDRRSPQRTGDPDPLSRRARGGTSAPRVAAGRRRCETAERISVSVGQAAAAGAQS